MDESFVRVLPWSSGRWNLEIRIFWPSRPSGRTVGSQITVCVRFPSLEANVVLSNKNGRLSRATVQESDAAQLEVLEEMLALSFTSKLRQGDHY